MGGRTKQAVPRGTTTDEAPAKKFSLKENNRLEHEKKAKKREKTKKHGPEDVNGDIGDTIRLSLLTCLYNSDVFVRDIGISDASVSDLIEATMKKRALEGAKLVTNLRQAVKLQRAESKAASSEEGRESEERPVHGIRNDH